MKKVKRIKKIEDFLKKEINENIECYLVFDNTEIGSKLLMKYQDIGWGIGTVMIFNKDSNIFNWISETINNKNNNHKKNNLIFIDPQGDIKPMSKEDVENFLKKTEK